MGVVSARLPPEMEREIEWYARKERVGRTIAIRKVLDKGLKEIKLEHALEEYRKGKITLWKAASVAGVSLWEMLDIVKEKRISAPYTLEDLKEDITAAFEE